MGRLVLHFVWVCLYLLVILFISRVDDEGRLDVGQDFHDGIFILQQKCVVQDLLVVVVSPEVVNRRHAKFRVLLIEVDFVGVDLCILGVDQDLLISKDQLTFFGLTL